MRGSAGLGLRRSPLLGSASRALRPPRRRRSRRRPACRRSGGPPSPSRRRTSWSTATPARSWPQQRARAAPTGLHHQDPDRARRPSSTSRSAARSTVSRLAAAPAGDEDRHERGQHLDARPGARHRCSIVSANDAAYALAENAGGNLDQFRRASPATTGQPARAAGHDVQRPGRARRRRGLRRRHHVERLRPRDHRPQRARGPCDRRHRRQGDLPTSPTRTASGRHLVEPQQGLPHRLPGRDRAEDRLHEGGQPHPARGRDAATAARASRASWAPGTTPAGPAYLLDQCFAGVRVAGATAAAAGAGPDRAGPRSTPSPDSPRALGAVGGRSAGDAADPPRPRPGPRRRRGPADGRADHAPPADAAPPASATATRADAATRRPTTPGRHSVRSCAPPGWCCSACWSIVVFLRRRAVEASTGAAASPA